VYETDRESPLYFRGNKRSYGKVAKLEIVER